MYKLKLTRREKRQLFRWRWVIVAGFVISAGLLVWAVWVRPIQKQANISTFAACVQAGNPVQESYPEVCLTKAGKRFVNPKQDQAHKQSQTEQEELLPPLNPDALILDIEEWEVRLPLTEKTFDLGYTYIESGGEESVLFGYKRLQRKDFCKGDIGLRLTRSTAEHLPPFSPNNPAPSTKVGNYFYYASYAGSSCYDPENADQMALVTQIAGEQSLTQVTGDLLTKMIVMPKQ